MSEEISTSESSRLEPLSIVWHIFAAPQTLLVLMGLLGTAVLLSTMIPQIPSQVSGDPEAWLAIQPQMAGPNTGLIRALGLFDLYRSFWFRTLLALIGLTLSVRAVESGDLAWRATRRGDWTAKTFSVWMRRAAQTDLPAASSPPTLWSKLGHVLNQQGYHWAEVSAPPDPKWIAGRREFALWAWPVAYSALVVALLGLVIVDSLGWETVDWQPAPGEIQAIGHNGPYTVGLDAFDFQLGGDGPPCDYRSEITWLDGDVVIKRGVAGVGKPATFQGMAVRQIGYLPILRLTARDASDRPLAIQASAEEPSPDGTLEIAFPSAQAQPHISIPSRGLFLAMAFQPLSANGRPALHLVLLRDGRTEWEPVGILHESGTLHLEDVQLSIDLTYGPILRIDHHPAMVLVIGGMAIAVAFLAAGCLLAPRLMTIAVRADEDGAGSIRVSAIPGTRGSLWLPKLVSRLQEAIVDEA